MALAIVSVWNKEGLEPFVKGLLRHGIEILSTGGTASFLEAAKIPVRSISDYTGSPEILDGRVKSLHPKIHGGILARRKNPADMKTLAEHKIGAIDFVVVNLYPFTEKVAEIERAKKSPHESLVESIDIGGPTMIRAAAKNCEDVVVICDPADYTTVLEELDRTKTVSLETRRRLASKVFRTMAAYDAAVSRYFALEEQLLDEKGNARSFAPVEAVVLERVQELRYGENPHQAAALYRPFEVGKKSAQLWEQLQGKELSYNNILDAQATVDLFLDLYGDKQEVAAIIKHNNPCGAAYAADNVTAYKKARDCDPISAFGGIVAISGELSEELAKVILEGFVEVVLAEKISDGALKAFAAKKNVRLLKCDFAAMKATAAKQVYTYRSVGSDLLLQGPDSSLVKISAESVVSGKTTDSMLRDFQFAWTVCKHVKSNAIVIVKDGQAIGIGAGQMSRVDSARLSIERAKLHGFDVKGGISASDAFLPFADTLEVLNDAGVVGLVQPGGSIKDDAVIEVAKQRNVTMVFTGMRHFRH